MTDPDPLPTVADRLDRLLLWLRRQTPPRLGTTVFSALDSLKTDGPLRISELAEREALSQPGMTTLVNKLEAAGHAERFADPTDGRAALVRITEPGAQLLHERHHARSQVLLALLEELDERDRAALREIAPVLDRLLERAAAPRNVRTPAAARR